MSDRDREDKFRFVDPSTVSAPPSKLDGDIVELVRAILDGLSKDEVGVLDVPPGMTPRDCKLFVGRCASERKLAVVVWDNASDGKAATEIYVKAVDERRKFLVHGPVEGRVI
jgi:hypothetical protein